jgi:hypothetical protein
MAMPPGAGRAATHDWAPDGNFFFYSNPRLLHTGQCPI